MNLYKNNQQILNLIIILLLSRVSLAALNEDKVMLHIDGYRLKDPYFSMEGNYFFNSEIALGLIYGDQSYRIIDNRHLKFIGPLLAYRINAIYLRLGVVKLDYYRKKKWVWKEVPFESYQRRSWIAGAQLRYSIFSSIYLAHGVDLLMTDSDEGQHNSDIFLSFLVAGIGWGF